MLRQRVLSALVMVPVVIAAVWAGGPWMGLAVGLVAAVGVLELYRMCGVSQGRGLIGLGLLWTLFFPVVAYFRMPLAANAFLIYTVVVAVILVLIGPHRQLGPGHIAWVPIGAAYLGWTLSYLITLRGVSHGIGWVVLALFTTFATDTGAYFVGRTWGRHKLAPSISPAKTQEGAVGGLASAIATAVLLSLIFKLPLAVWQAALLGALVGVFAQLGDLAESKLKRITGVKDAGKLIPGHGGLLDRLDSVVFSVPIVYYVYYVLFGGWH